MPDTRTPPTSHLTMAHRTSPLGTGSREHLLIGMRFANLASSLHLDPACSFYRLENCAPWKASLPDVAGGQLRKIRTCAQIGLEVRRRSFDRSLSHRRPVTVTSSSDSKYVCQKKENRNDLFRWNHPLTMVHCLRTPASLLPRHALIIPDVHPLHESRRIRVRA
jgi:hypothetical protein